MPETEAPAVTVRGMDATGGWRRQLLSLDHKVIGRQYLVGGAAMGILGALLSLLLRWQLAWPGHEIPGLGPLEPPAYNAVLTLHGTVMLFFFAMPILLGGFGTFLVPLQIGASRLAFPRLSRLSLALFGLASLILLGSFGAPEGPASAGWTAYPPLSADPAYTGVGLGFDLWLLAMFLELVSFALVSVNLLTTIANHRAPGLTLGRLPLFVWMQGTSAAIFLLSVGPLLAAALMLAADRHWQTGFFLPGEGGDPLLWQHLFWFFGHPEVYVLLLPGLGILLEVFPVFARKPLFAYPVIVGATLISAALSFLVWAHHMFVSGLDARLATPFSVTTMLISVPFAVIVFALLATLAGAAIRFTAALWFALAALSSFLLGGLTGVVLGSPPVDVYLHDTYFVVAHLHAALLPSVVFGALAGLYFWFPKLTGRQLDERLGKIHALLTFAGFMAVFLPMFAFGIGGHMRRLYDPSRYEFLRPLADLHVFVTLAAFVLFAAQAILLWNLWRTWRSGPPAPANPWQANTLEWQTESPPPPGNFATPPRVYRGPYEYSRPGADRDDAPQSAAEGEC